MRKSLPIIIIIILIAVGVWMLVSTKGSPKEEIVTGDNTTSSVDKVVQEPSEQTSATSVLQPPTPEDLKNLKEMSVILKTNMGDIIIQLLPQKSPVAVANFLNLVRANFYDGVKFHRVIPNFMIQTGDPNSKDNNWVDDGTGGPGYAFSDEVTPADRLLKGTVAMANAGPNTNGSQFFIVTAASTPWLNGKHTIFGTVVAGMDVVDAIAQVPRNEMDHPLTDVVIRDVEVGE